MFNLSFLQFLVCELFSFIKIDYLTRWFLGPKKVTIIVYHNPQAEIFEQHAEYLNRYYNFLPLTALVDAIHQDNWSAIPDNSIVLTFDDGHADNFFLLPIFKKYNIQPTIFICTNVVGTNRKYWWMDKDVREVEKLKKIPNRTRLKTLKVAHKYSQDQEFPRRQRAALSFREIEEMLPYVHFGNHTQFHPIVTNLEEEEFQNELLDSMLELKNIIPYPLDHFAYPNGDYSEREIDYLSKNGFKSGRTIEVGWNSPKTNPFALKVTGITDNASIAKMKFQLSGLFGVLLIFKKYFSK